MFVTVITDCKDSNAMGKQITRIGRLFGSVTIANVGVKEFCEPEAAGNLIDMLDASDGEEGAILVNIAPRHGRGKKWPNGTPFGFFFYKKTLVVATIADQTLSLVKKFGLTTSLKLTDIPTVINYLVEQGKLSRETGDHIIHTQFRSYEYMPRLAKWVMDGINVPTEEYSFDAVDDMPKCVWWVDNFGNSKTTVFPEEVGFEPGKTLETKIGKLQCYSRLKDVPDGEPGLIVGSSGLGDKRFLEIVVQGKSAAERFDITVGTDIF